MMKLCELVPITNVISEGSEEPALLCNQGLAAHELKVLKWIRLRPKKNLDIDLRTSLIKLCLKYANINLYEFYVFLSSAKRAAGPCSAVGNVSGYRCVSDC